MATYNYGKDNAFIIIEPAMNNTYPVKVVKDKVVIKKYWLQNASMYNNSGALARYYYLMAIKGEKDCAKLQQALDKAVKKPKRVEPHTQAGFVSWLREHMEDVVGYAGSFSDTPVKRYCETRKTWKKVNFEFGNACHPIPRWMMRLKYYQQGLDNRPLRGCEVLSMMSNKEEWDKEAL